MSIHAFLARIAYPLPAPGTLPEPTLKNLFTLCNRMTLTLPYENLSIYHPPTWHTPDPTLLDRPFSVPTDAAQPPTPLKSDLRGIYRKLVEHHRGGFCYELNSLLCWALGELGYEVGRWSAKVIGGMTEDHPFADRPDTHVVLRVDVSEEEAGRFAALPPTLDGDGVTPDGPRWGMPRVKATTWLVDCGSTRVALWPVPLMQDAEAMAPGGYGIRLTARRTWLGRKGWTCLTKEPTLPAGVKAEPNPNKYIVATEGPDAGWGAFFFFDSDAPSSHAYAEKVMAHVCDPRITPPFPPGFTELCGMPTADGGFMMVIGTAEKGYKFMRRDRLGVEVERIVIEGGEEGKGKNTKAWDECQVLLKERFGIWGFGGDV
ncbi:hypothetical protein HK101_010875 [Irineochytrium annulatum]|nr:hypothetical protein HK101_010875 [Irineochytrium annulatum]